MDLGGPLFCLRPEKFASGLGSRADMEFVVKVPEMPADCSIGETEARGNDLVRETRSHQFEDLAFALRETFHLRSRGHRFLEGKNHLASNFPRHRRASVANLTDGGDEFFVSGMLPKVTACSRS